MENNSERKFLLYIIIIIFVISLGLLSYRVGKVIIKSINNQVQARQKEKEEIKEAKEKLKKEQEEREKAFKKDTFNNDYEFYVGSKTKSSVEYLIDNVIKNNKTNNEKIIEVIYNGNTYGIDPDKILTIKDNLKDFVGFDFQYYEVSLGYDNDGYVNKVTILER